MDANDRDASNNGPGFVAQTYRSFTDARSEKSLDLMNLRYEFHQHIRMATRKNLSASFKVTLRSNKREQIRAVTRNIFLIVTYTFNFSFCYNDFINLLYLSYNDSINSFGVNICDIFRETII